MNSNVNITLRRLAENDWLEFSEIRLHALQIDPNVFGSNYEKESHFTETDWRNRLKNNAVFLLESGEMPIGITGAAIDRDDPTGKTAVLWGSWLAPDFRARGISDLMYDARIEWAKSQPNVERLLVAHRASNRTVESAIRKHGFVETHREDFVWADGTTEDLVSHELKIKI